MSKVLAESLKEYRDSKESINEAKGLFGDLASQGKQFRKMFLPASYAIIKSGKKEQVVTLGKWLQKLSDLGWPSDKELKAKVGEKGLKSLQQANKFLNNNLSSFAATPGGTTSGKSVDTGKDDQERLIAIGQVLGMAAQDIVDLLKKT